MIYLPGAGQMKEADRYTIERLHVPSLELMERAAASCVSSIKEKGFDLTRVLVVCGSGNNGGDGFAIARMLVKEGVAVHVFLAGNREHCTAETETQIRLLEETGAAICNEYPEDEYSIIIDAIFGVGLSRKIEGHYAEVIEKMNQAPGIKMAVDIPSGISADTGCVLGTAFRADLTVTFQAEKLGMSLYPGKEYCGEVKISDIGISSYIFENNIDVAYTNEEREFAAFLPQRKEDSHKGTYGKLLIIAGSKGMSGAAYLNGLSAYLTGAGLVRIYTPQENRIILQELLPEAIITVYDHFCKEEVVSLLAWADAVCIGSGIGTDDRADSILKTVLENADIPCVVDADGLNLIGKDRQYLEKLRHENYIFTPHIKEMSRLTGIGVADIKNERMKLLKEFVEKYRMTCILKDARTAVQSRGERTYINMTGNCAMAKAGSGDVLAGIAAGLLVQGITCRDAAVLAVYLHGKAGDRARTEKGSYSVMARDLMSNIAIVLKEMEEE